MKNNKILLCNEVESQVKEGKMKTNEQRQVDRNLKGIELEKSGKVEEAIKLYEANLAENFEGSHAYDRLIVIYSKQKNVSEVIRVLQKAIYVFENIVFAGRGDRLPKLNKYREKLEKIVGKQ